MAGSGRSRLAGAGAEASRVRCGWQLARCSVAVHRVAGCSSSTLALLLRRCIATHRMQHPYRWLQQTAHLIFSSGLALEMKKNIPAVSMPASVACRWWVVGGVEKQ